MRRIYAIGILLLCPMALTGCSIVERVLNSQQSEQERTNGMFTELNSAIREGNLNEVQRLLDEGASPNIVADYRSGVDAVDVGNLSLVVSFNENPGPDVDSSLQSAVMFDQVAIVRLLLDYGAKGLTMAKTTYNAAMLNLLEDAGATIDNRLRHETHPEDYKTEEGVRAGTLIC